MSFDDSYMETIGSHLVRKYIIALWVSDDNETLVFETRSDGLIGYAVEGDCCSRSWFNDITGVRDLLGHIVTAAEHIDAPYEAKPDDDYYDCLQTYGTRLTTDAGTVDIVFRNESNGYYGGWANLLTDPSTRGLTRIREDWTA